jgi:hypothetical protein
MNGKKFSNSSNTLVLRPHSSCIKDSAHWPRLREDMAAVSFLLGRPMRLLRFFDASTGALTISRGGKAG